MYQVRDWNKLTQVQFAEGLGKSTPAFFCDDNVICRVEKGIRDVEPEFLAAVSARFGVSLHWLITGTGAVTAEPDAFKDRTIIEKWSDFRLDLNSEKFDYDTPEDFPAVDASTFNDPESFTTLLKYMIHDVDIRERMFKQFFMIDKPSADRKHKG
ncbi:MAG: helix-turn-helix transcriptional regulator [bacterium]|nr:helix-turn-helix transcriptional regulator [bacterium]